MANNGYHLTGDFILEMVAASIKDRNFFEGIVDYLKPNYLYDDDIQYLWGVIKKLYARNEGKHIKRLSIPTIRQFISQYNKKGKHEGVLELLDEVRDVVVENKDELLKSFEEFVRASMFIDIYQEVGKSYNDGEQDKAFKSFIKKAEEFSNFTLASANFSTVFSGFTDRTFQRFTQQRDSYQILTGIEPLDNDTHGGFYTGETELWLGDSGVGKSKMLVGRSIATAKWGGVVLHVQAEGTQEQCIDNFDAAWTGQNYYDLKNGNFDQDRLEKFIKAADKYNGEVVVKTVSTFDSINMRQIRQWCIDVLKTYGRLDHLVIDYMELVLPDFETSQYGTGDEFNRNAMTQVARKCKNIAVEFNILVTTAAQSHTIDKEFTNNPHFVLSRYNIGKNKRIMEPFSYFMTINQTDDERKLQRARIFVDKYREVSAGQIHLIKQSLRNSRFYDHKGTLEIAMEEMTDEEMEVIEGDTAGTREEKIRRKHGKGRRH